MFNINKNFIFKIINNDIKNKNIKKINTRFSPDPNGFLHIGHVKSIFINYYIAKYYNGIFNLRFDDTNPLSNSIFYVNYIKNDIKWLNLNWDGNEKYTSDYFDKIFLYAIKLINKNLAYVDELSIDLFKKYKGTYKNTGINSPYRDRTIEENIECFMKMKNGFYKENKACLRAKINMNSSNINMRDPVLYRIKYINHFRTKKKWCIYPTYDFSHCISDSLENITYSLCTLEFQDNNILYNWILNSLDIKNKPIQYEFSKLEIEYYLLSKRKLNLLIKNNIIKKWNDPRMPTISGFKKRGYTNNSIINFCKDIGITKNNSILKIKYLENFLKKDLNNISIRIMSVINPILLIIDNFNENDFELIKSPNNPNLLNLGYKNIFFSKILYIDKYDFYDINNNYEKFINNIIKLKYSYIIKILYFKKNFDNSLKEIHCKYYFNTLNTIYYKNIKVKKIIHWVSYKKNFKSIFRIYNYLFNNPFPNKSKNIFNVINKNSLIIKNGFTEKNSENYKKYIPYQLERIGYFYINKINYNNNNLIFNQIIKI